MTWSINQDLLGLTILIGLYVNLANFHVTRIYIYVTHDFKYIVIPKYMCVSVQDIV